MVCHPFIIRSLRLITMVRLIALNGMKASEEITEDQYRQAKPHPPIVASPLTTGGVGPTVISRSNKPLYCIRYQSLTIHILVIFTLFRPSSPTLTVATFRFYCQWHIEEATMLVQSFGVLPFLVPYGGACSACCINSINVRNHINVFMP